MEVLDDIPAGGRLTRSLRKRLNSVDSEASSSRPGTPIGTKLNSITEQNSPPRSMRITRRNSVTNPSGTPAKTPSKAVSGRTAASRIDNKIEVSSPMRRVNRRRSVSITEDEEATEVKSIKSIVKIEEVPEEESNTSKRVTRSASKSPQQPLSNGKSYDKSISPISKSPTQTLTNSKSQTKASNSTEKIHEIDSDVEVIDLDTDEEEKGRNKVKQKNGNDTKPEKSIETETKTPRKYTRKSIKENKKIVEEHQMKMELENSPIKSPQNSPQKSMKENNGCRTIRVNLEKIEKSPVLQNTSKTELTPKSIKKLQTKSTTKLEEKNGTIQDAKTEKTESEIEKNDEVKSYFPNDISNKSVSGDDIHNQDDVDSKEKCNGSAIVTEVIDLKRLSPDAVNHIIGNLNGNIKNINTPDKLKSVGFIDSIAEDDSKSSYPKTPCLTKSKSYIELDSSCEADKDHSFEVMEGNELDQEKPKEQTDSIQTPIQSKTKLKSVQSSTPLLNDTTKGSPKVIAKIEEDLAHLEDVDDSPSKSPKKSYSLRCTSLSGTPKSPSVGKSPKKTSSNSNLTKCLSEGEEKKNMSFDTTQSSKHNIPKNSTVVCSSESDSAEHSIPPNTSLEKNSSNELESTDSLVKKDDDEQAINSDLSKDSKFAEKSSCAFEVNRKKWEHSSMPSPTNVALKRLSKKSPKPDVKESLKSPKMTTTSFEEKTTESPKPKPMETSQIWEKADEETSQNYATQFPTSWTPGVVGKTNESKIDNILVENGEREQVNETLQKSSTSIKVRRRSRIKSDDSDNSANECNNDEELTETEKPYAKHEFILGEAMEIDDYQSGDSMDSDEREELENNEIPCDGESISSEDTIDDNEGENDEDDDDDDDDEDENDSFIADDSNEESLLDYSDDEEETENLLEVERKNKKNVETKTFRRILRVDDDDDDDDDKDDDGDEEEAKGVGKKKHNESGGKNSFSEEVQEDEEIGTLIENIGKIINDNFKKNDADDEKLIEKNPFEESYTIKNTVQEENKQPNENHNKTQIMEGTRLSLKQSTGFEEKTKNRMDDKDCGENKETTLGYRVQDQDKEIVKLNESIEGVHHIDKDQDSKCNEYEYEDNEKNDNEDINLDCSEINQPSENSLRPHISSSEDEENSLNSSDCNDEKTILNRSRKKIIKQMQQSDRFNKTVHDFREESQNDNECSSTTPEIAIDRKKDTTKLKRRALSLGSKMDPERLSSNQYINGKVISAHPAESDTKNNNSDEGSNQSEENQQNVNTLGIESSNKKKDKINRLSAGSSVKTQDEATEDEEIIALNGNATLETMSEKNTSEKQEKLMKLKTKKKKRNSTAALSVSLGHVKKNYNKEPLAKNLHSSFTIGIAVRNGAKKRGTTPEVQASPDASFNDDSNQEDENILKVNASDVEPSNTANEAAEFSSADEEQLKKLVHHQEAPLSAGLNSSAVFTMQSTESIRDFKNSSKQRRTISIPADYGDFTTSQSFIECVAAEKRGGEFITEQSSTKRKRLSKSFCAGASLDLTLGDEDHHLNKKSKLGGYDNAVNSSTPVGEEKQSRNKVCIPTDTFHNEDINVEQINNKGDKSLMNMEEHKTTSVDMKQRVLDRCEEILEAANRAKLEDKINSNKNKVKLLKKKNTKKTTSVQEQEFHNVNRDKKERDRNITEETEMKINSKELMRQEKAKLEIVKALRASANLILDRREKMVLKSMTSQKQLPKNVLDEVRNSELTLVSKENRPNQISTSKTKKRIHKTSAGDVLEICLDEKEKRGKVVEEIQLSTGTVRVESVTPTKHLIRSGFRESPMTPLSLGYKVRNILSAGQDAPPIMPVKDRKRKRNLIEEPIHSLPKPQWTRSGVFVEEEIYASAPITTGGSTKFTVNALNSVRQKKKKLSKIAANGVNRVLGASSVTSSALQFKNNALFRSDIQRESSRELIHRKQRKNI